MTEADLIRTRDAIFMAMARHLAGKYRVDLADPEAMATTLSQVEALIENWEDVGEDEMDQCADPALQRMLNEHHRVCDAIQAGWSAGGAAE